MFTTVSHTPRCATPLHTRALPKTPVLGWNSLWPEGRRTMPSIGDLRYRAYTSSGRAALHAALLQMKLPVGSGVLVPTYHCPTMVAPIVEAGMRPVFYGLDALGLPALERIDPAAGHPRAMFVAHFFGLAKSLHAVQAWCRKHGIVLVEDCAHSYYGMAGDRPVGQWGDFATASLSKFFPVPEAGILACARQPLQPLKLQAAGWRSEAKAAWDIIDLAQAHRRLPGLTHALLPVFWMRRSRPDAASAAEIETRPDAEAIRQGCDMGRVRQAPCWAGQVLHRSLPEGRIVNRRRNNYQTLAHELSGASGAHALVAELPAGSVPYVLPLFVDGAARADAVYGRLRAQRVPVFRWDRLWPGTPYDESDVASHWSRQVIQLLCHQDLTREQLVNVVKLTRSALAATLATDHS